MKNLLFHSKPTIMVFALFLLIAISNNAIAAIALRGTATSATTTSTSLTINKPTGVVAGDVMIVNINQLGNTSTDPVLTGWTLIDGATASGSSRYGAILYRIADGTEGTNFTFTLGTGVTQAVGSIIAFSGVSGFPFDVAPGTINTTQTYNYTYYYANASTITTATNNAGVIFLAHSGANGTANQFSNWSGTTPTFTEIMDIGYGNGTSYPSVGAAWGSLGTAGSTGAKTVRLTDAYYCGGILIALRPSSGTAPTITNLNGATSGCQGTSITINGTNLTGATATSVRIGGTSVASITSQSATQIVAVIGAGTTGRVTVGTLGGTAVSSSNFTVYPTSVGGTATAAASPICTGTSTTVTVTGYTGSIQWQQSANGSSGWANVTGGSGGTTATYTTPNLTATTYYRAVVTSGTCSSTNSTTAQVTINSASVGGTAAAASSPICSGTSTSITVTGYNGTIQWQQSANGSTGWANVTGGSGGTTATYTTPNLTATTYYRAVVTNSPCSSANSTTASVTVNALPTATISYSGTPYCSNEGTASVTISGISGGPLSNTSFSSTAGLVINSATGDITLGTSTAGTYTVTYSFTGANSCPNTATTSVTITAAPSATIAYGGSPYCSTAGTVAVTRTGTSGGTYTAAPTGLSINSGTGAVNTGASTAGTYTVTYTIAATGGCPIFTTTAPITIDAAPTVTPGGPDNDSQCAPEAINLTGASVGGGATTGAWLITSGGGTLSSTAQTPNPASVTYTPAENFSGTVTLTLTTNTNGACPAASGTRTINVNKPTVVNYDFNSGSSYGALVSNALAGITSTVTGPTFTTSTTSTATGTNAFTQNTTSGNALSGSSGTINWTFTLTGTTLNRYKNFKIYYQTRRLTGGNGTPSLTAYYNLNAGGNSTTGITIDVGNNPYSLTKTYTEIKLSMPSSVNNPSNSLAFVLSYSNSGGTRTVVLDNFQVQAEYVSIIDKTPTAQSSSICSGTSTNIQIPTSEVGVSYQLRNGGTNVGSPVAGTGGTISLPTGNLTSTTTFNVLASDGTGCSLQMANTVTVSVVENLPVSVSLGADATSVCAGTTVNFTASPTNGGTNPVYAWYKNSALVGSVTGPTYSYMPVDGDEIYVQLTSEITCVTGNPATSNPVTITVLPFAWKISVVNGNWEEEDNWCGGVPTGTTNVTIPGTATIHITSAPGSPAVCNNLIINGTLIIDEGKALTVNGTLTNNSGTLGLVIKDGGSLIYTAGTIDGTAQRDVTAGVYHFLSSPVTSTTFGNVFPNNQNLIWAQVYNEPTGGWNNQTIASPLIPGIGYSVWIDPSLGAQTALFSGTFNNSGVTQTLSKVNTGGNPNLVGWNLLGNPYTSAIDWDLGSWHGSVINSVYIWNGTQYHSYVNGVPSSEGIIPPQNGFFVKTNTNGSTITIPWAARVHSSQVFYKDAIPNVLHLGITGNNYRDDAYIRFNTDASSGFDDQYDAYKLWGITDAPQLYSIIPGDVLSINALPSTEANPIVSLGLKVGAETTYTLTASGMNSFDPSVPVRLDDLKLGTTQDLRLNDTYTFTAAPGDPENRFNIRFYSPVGMEEPALANLFVWADNRNIVVNNAGGYKGLISVYNTAGQLLKTLNMEQGMHSIITLPVGVYIVKASTGKAVISHKVVLF